MIRVRRCSLLIIDGVTIMMCDGGTPLGLAHVVELLLQLLTSEEYPALDCAEGDA